MVKVKTDEYAGGEFTFSGYRAFTGSWKNSFFTNILILARHNPFNGESIDASEYAGGEVVR